MEQFAINKKHLVRGVFCWSGIVKDVIMIIMELDGQWKLLCLHFHFIIKKIKKRRVPLMSGGACASVVVVGGLTTGLGIALRPRLEH